MIEKRITIAATDMQLVKEGESAPLELSGDGWRMALDGFHLSAEDKQELVREIEVLLARHRREDGSTGP